MTTANRKDRTVPVEFAPCRTWMHAWDPTTVKQDGRILIQGMVCLRCSTMRYVNIDSRTGMRRGNKYDYPDGYTLSDGGGPLTQRERAALRLSEVKRHLT